MRVLPVVVALPALLLFPNTLMAGSPRIHHLDAVTVDARPVRSYPSRETYRGQLFDVSAIKGRDDLPQLIEGLRHQIDAVQDLKLSPRILTFFRTVPIVVDDFGCMGNMTSPTSGEPKPAMMAACYGRRVPATIKTSAVAFVWGRDVGPQISETDPLLRTMTTGVVFVRPTTLVDQNKTRPIILHELLHAYHDHVLPNGFSNFAAESWFKQASEQSLYPADQYLMMNEREFFAVTASVFLSGKDGPFTRADLKKKQPNYYKYLTWLFEFDPDHGSSASPVASAE